MPDNSNIIGFEALCAKIRATCTSDDVRVLSMMRNTDRRKDRTVYDEFRRAFPDMKVDAMNDETLRLINETTGKKIHLMRMCHEFGATIREFEADVIIYEHPSCVLPLRNPYGLTPKVTAVIASSMCRIRFVYEKYEEEEPRIGDDLFAQMIRSLVYIPVAFSDGVYPKPTGKAEQDVAGEKTCESV